MEIAKLSEMDRHDIQKISDDVFVMPTETVYGLAARIDREDALKSIFRIKGRPSDNPLVVHVSSLEMLRNLIAGDIPDEYQKLIESFWPGPLSLIFRCKGSVSMTVRGGVMDTLAIRMPKSETLRNLIDRIGVPLAAPSANTSGRPSPTTVEHAMDDLGDKVPFYIDGGPCEVGLESSIFGILESGYVLLRPGSITREQIERTIGSPISVRTKANDGEVARCPGQKYRHYSPSSPVYLFQGERWQENMRAIRVENKNKKIGIMRLQGLEYDIDFEYSYNLGLDKKECSRNIFAGLRLLDKNCDMIFVRGFDLCDEGLAIMDRLDKAASFVIE